MAYAVTVTRTKVADSNVDFVYDITETDSTSGGDEFTIDLPTSTGRILRYKTTVSSGSGNLDTLIGVSTSPSGLDVVLENGTADSTLDLQPDPVLFYASDKKLYINNKASAGSLAIKTRIFIRETWGL